MARIKSVLHRYYQEIIIFLLTGIVFVLNLTPGNYLLGWDSLQTELDPVLGIQRAFFSAWQEFQSFGLAAGMAHAADLIRAVLILPLTLVLPNWLVRYSLHILMLFLAGLGMLRLLRHSLQNKQHRIFALAGSVFYMFNYAVIQIMYIPFEAFSVFFATLPWLLLTYLKLLTSQKPLRSRDWLLFVLINFLATPSFVAQQLFVVYGMVLTLLTVGIFVTTPKFHLLKRAVIGALLILIANAFWLFPQGYFLITNGDVVTTSKINQIATADVLYSNIDRGHLTDFLSFTGFFNDRLDQNQKLLFANWQTHRKNPVIIGIMILTTIVMLLGLFQKSRYRMPFALIGILVGVALLGSTQPFATLNDLIRSQDLINQIFRSPFTKFAIPHALIGAYFFTFGMVFLSSHLPKTSIHLTNKLTRYLLTGICLFLLLFLALPIFRGQYFSPTMKVTIPQEYFSLTTYLKSQDSSKRIALLPDYTFWGWIHTKWGYNGSGFLWYGVKQPLVSRNFDYWSSESERYFWELKQAVEAEDSEALLAVLNKYDIDYLLFDTSLLPLVADQKSLQYDLLETMLAENESISEEKTFGFLKLFAVKSTIPQRDFISLATEVPNIGPRIHMTNDDTAYKTYGTYQTDLRNRFDAYFPFLDLMTQTRFASDNWTISNRPASFGISTTLPGDIRDYQATSAAQTAVDLYSDDTAVKYLVPLQETREGNLLTLSFPQLPIDSFTPAKAAVGYCLLKTGTLNYTKAEHEIHITTNGGATGCIEYKNELLDQRYGYLVRIDHQNTDGLGLYFYVLDTTKEQAYIEDRLTNSEEFYILGPRFTRGLGYSFTFQNTSYRTIPSTNTLQDLSVYLMPYDSIKSYELKNPNTPVQNTTFSNDFSVQKLNSDKYDITLKKSDSIQTLILTQSYQPGWRAYLTDSTSTREQLFPFLYSESVTDHIVINNWANGWNIDTQACPNETCTVSLVYFPQYLQYSGMGMLLLTSLLLFTASIWPQKRPVRLDKARKNDV